MIKHRILNYKQNDTPKSKIKILTDTLEGIKASKCY